VSMTGKIEQVEVITSVQRRRRWSGGREGDSRTGDLRAGHVGLAGAHRHGIAPNQLFTAGGASRPLTRAREARLPQHMTAATYQADGKLSDAQAAEDWRN
jgi:hypothetical protein